MRKGFKGFMNKVFKVVWSKSKECYVVVPEIAKNNSGKKKVLASVLAGLAVAGAMGGIAPQQAMADADYGNSHVNIWANTHPGFNGENYNVGQNSIVVGYQNQTDYDAGHDGKVAIGARNKASANSAMAMGNRNNATAGAATAIGAGNDATADTTLAVGNKNNANKQNAIAIGAYNNQNWTEGSWQTTPKQAGAYSLAIGNFNDALGSRATAIGSYTTAKGEWATAIGAQTTASGDGDVAIGDTSKTNATGVGHAVAVGWHAETGAANAVAVGPSALASGKNSVSVGTNNNSRVQDTVTMGQDNDAKTMGGIAIGKNNMVDSTNGGTNHPETRDENSQIAIGRDNTATHLDTIAIGRDTHATGSGATVVGARADASGNNAIAIGNSGKNSRRVTASGVNSIAVGMQSQATGEATIAQGAAAEAAGNFGIAVGRISKAKANYSQAYGNEATSSTMGSIAMGTLAKGGNDNGAASEGGSVAVGNAAWATGNRAIAIGSIRPTEGNLKYPTGVGKDVATGLQGTDYNTQATANQAIAVGSGARTDAQNSITMGTNAKVDATANGYTYQKTNNAGVKETLTLSTDPTPTSGINSRTTYDAGNGIAIGRDSHVTGKTTSAIAIGNSALADDGAVGATVIGAGASSKSVSSVAIGTTANVQGGEGAVAVGSGATVTGNYDNAAAFGSGATVNKTNGTALGAGAQTNVRGGVAIGALSQADERSGAGESTGFHAANRTREYQGENKGLADNNLQLFHADIAGGDAGMVSVGNDGIKRQITNVASGTSDYDAVNVAQLRNVGVVVTGDTGKSDFLVHDGKLNVVGTGRVSTTAANDGAKDSKITVAFDDKGMVKAGKNVTVDEKTVNGRTTYTINAADAAAKYDFLTNATANGGKADGNATPTKVESGQTVNYAAGKNLTVKQDIQTSLGQQTYTYSLNKDLKEITSITNNGGPTLHFGDNNISVTGGNLDLGDHNITNLKSGGDVINNAANIGDVTRISKANDLHIAPTAGTNNNVAEYTVDGNKKVTLTYQDGNGKTVTGPKAVIDLSGLPTGDMSSFNVKSSATEGKVAQGSAGVQEIRDGKTVEMQAGKNMTVKQTNKNGNAAVEFALNKDIDLTPDGSITIGDTNITDNGLTINNGPSITKTGINAGGLNITNVKAGVNDNDAVNVSQLKKVRADERHIKPGEYAVDANGKVTMTYLDGNNKDVANETAVITGIAKQDLSNINKGGETVIQNLAKKAINMENGKNTKVSNREINGVKTFKVDVEGDLNDITSITNNAGDGKVVFGGNQTVNVAGDHNINLNAKVGDITGLTNVTLDAPDFAKKGRAATEEQLSIVNNGFNNTVGLTGNTGATDLQKLNQAGGLSFGVVGANNGQYIKTTASGSNVAVDLSDDAKGKLNNTVEVRGKNAAKVTSVTENTVDGGKKTIYTVDVDNVTPTAASTEKVKAKANVTGSTDTNIAKVTPQAGDQYGDAGATYEVNVSRNDVKDAAREAVTVNTTNTTNNPITVKPVQDETNHNTTYTVTFDGNKAATQIPLTYKANGQNAQTVTLDKGLNFTNGKNTTASVDAEGVVKYDVNKDLVNINSISNTTNGPKMEFGPNSINITNGPINMGDQNITNLKSGGDVINNAANIGDVKRISKVNDLHIAPTTSDRTGETTTSYAYDTASKSVTLKYNDGNGANQAGTIAKIDLSGLADQIKDGYSFSTDAKGNVVGNHAVTAVGNGKTVSYAAGDNLTVKQDINATTGEHTYTYALSNDIKVGKDGKDGIDGKIGVNGKDGSAVVINGKDGSIGLNGKDGKDGLTIRGEKGQDGVDGKNGTNGITRIVYEDHNNDKHEVATLDDGMKYAGDDAQGTDKSKVIAKKLNETMDIVGGADKTKLTDNNIGVNNDNGKLKVQLAQNIDLTPNGSLKIGDTILNNGGLTITGGPSVLKTGINAGGLNITNVKAGVNDTDAVNVKQLKDARTVVTSNDNSVTVNKTENGNQVTYDLHVAPGAAQSVWNVKSTGNTTADSETAAKTISDGKTVEMAAGKNLTVKQTSNNDGAKVEFDLANDIKIGKDGKDGVDGKIGVNGKDGSSVVINGKDGSIGLNGKDGKDGLTMKGEKGQPGLNGKDGITRIVYEDNNHDKHEVATLDDGLNFTGNNTDTVNKQKLNSLVKVQGEGVDKNTSATFKSAAGNINVKADGTDTLEVQLNKDLKNINTIKNGGNATFTIGGDNFAFNGGNVSIGGNNITNLKSGIVNNNSTDDTNGANIGDVKTISKANDLHIAPTTSDRAGETTTSYSYNTADKSVTLKYNDGNGANQAGTIAKIDLSGLADQIKDGYSFSTDAKGNVVGNHAVTAVGNGKTVSYAAGDNLTVKQDINATTGEHTYTYALSNDIKVGKDGKDGIDGKIGVNGKDGSAVVINGKDGSIGLNGKDGKDGLTIRGEKGQDGVDGKNGTNGITRIVYEDHNNDKHEVATLDDGMKYAGDDAQGTDKSKVIAKKLNETMDIVGGADKSKLTDNNIGVNNVDGKLKVQLSKEVNLTPSGSLTIGDTVVNNNGLTISGGPSITKTGINAGNKTIVNVDAGVNDTDAVNVKQLKTAKTEVKAGNNVTVDTTYGNDGHTIYTVNANDVVLGDAVLKYSANGTNTQSVKLSQGLNFVDGNYTSASVDANGQVKYDVTIGKVKDGVDGKPGVDGNDGIATVKTVVDTINNSGWKGDVTGNTVNNHAATIVKPGTTVNFGAGKNLTVEQIVDRVTGDHTYNYALSDDIKVGKDGKDGVDGKIGVNGKDGSSVVINGKDGSIGLNGKDGKDGLTMKAKDGQPGVNGKDGITRIVYEDNSKTTHEVATLDDGMKYAGDDAQGTDKSKVIAKKLNQTMDIVGGADKTKLTDNNIGVNNVDGKLKVQLSNTINLTPAGSLTIGGTSITDNGLVINQGPSITKGGINAGNKTIVNVAPGVNGTDAVNVNQLNSARTEVEEGDNVTVTSRKGANGQTIYKVSATGVNLGDAELNYRANGGTKQKVKLSEGLNFVDGNYTSASVDANGQVKYDVNLGNIKQGTDGKPGVDGKDGIATVKTVVDTINNSGWKANATGNVVGTSTATIVKPGNTVNYGAGKNLNVKQTVNGEEQTYEFALDKDLKELNSVQTNTIHLGSPTSHTTINYNAGNDRIEYTTKNGTKQVANLDDIWTIQANGTDVKPVGGKVNVVGGDHIKVSTDAAGKMTISADGVGTMNGFNVKSTGNTTNDSDKTAKNITDGKTVEFSGGKNLTVKQTNTADGAKVEFALNNNIDLTPNGSVTIGDTVVNNDGLTITGGPTITKNNVDMGGQQIHNVKSGGDVDANGANIGDIKRISKANDTRIKDGNYEVSQNGTVEMTYVDGSGKQLVDEHGNPVKATISGIARQDLSNITNEGKKVITGLGTIVKAGQNVSVDEATDNATGQKTYTVNADLSGAKVYAGVGTDGSGVAKGLKNPAKVEKGTQYIAGDNMVVERKHVDGDDKLDNSITYSLAHDLTEINSISNGGATLRINSNPGGNKYDRDTAVTPAFEVHGGNLSMTGNRIVNLAPGIDGTDGVNVNQLRDSLTTVKSTDGTVRVTDLSTDPNKHEYDLHVNPAADPRVDKLGEEIGHVGAQSAALSALKPIQYDPMEPTQIMWLW